MSRYSPGELQIFIHHHVSPARYERPDTDRYRETVARLVQEGLLGVDLLSTERGAAFMEMLCNTPLPENRWIDPRSGETP